MRYRISQPDQLIVAVPYLLGFVPGSSLVIVHAPINGQAPATDVVMRFDDACFRQAGATELARLVASRFPDGDHQIIALVVGDGTDPGTDPLPHANEMAAFEAALSEHEVSVVWSLFTPAITAAARWRAYHDPAIGGELPEPSSSPLAADTVHHGMVTFATRDDYAARLAPAAWERRERIDDLLDQRLSDLIDEIDNDKAAVVRRCLDTVDRALTAARSGHLPDSDDEIVDLLAALAIPPVRDAQLTTWAEPEAHRAQELWIHLLRLTDGPLAEDMALLVAANAYCRGEGTLASIALEGAPQTQLFTRVLDKALATGMHPTVVQTVMTKVATAAREALSTPSR